MKKILFNIYNLSGGGAERVLVKILEKINKKNFYIDLFLIFEKGIYTKQLEKKKIKSFYSDKFLKLREKNIIFRKITGLYLKLTYKLFLNKSYFFERKLDKNYDVEIAFLEGPTSKLIANHKTNAKKIAWVHIDLEKHRTMPIEEEREIYKEFDKIICVSNASKQSVLNLYPEYEDKIEVIYNPIDKEEIIEKSKEQVKDIREGKITLVTVGRLNPQKGYDLLLEAHNQLLKEGLDYNLVILGEGALQKEFEDFIKKNNIEKNTNLLGFQSNPYPYIKQGDIFIMSSRYEGYPLVLCEAVTLGKPIIATNCTGPTEILDNGKYGMLIPSEDILALKNAMREMVKKEELRKKYSQLALERSSIFNIEDVMRQIERLLDAE